MDITEKTLDPLGEVSGFVAGYIYYGTGEIIVSKAPKEMENEQMGGLAVEMYVAAKTIVDRMGLGTANFVEVHTDKFIFIHTCVVPGIAAMGVILSKSGNIGLMRFHMTKLSKALIPEFNV